MFLLLCQLSDILFFTLVLLGVEQMRIVPGFTATNDFDLFFMPYSHSLVGSVLLSCVVFFLSGKNFGYALATLSHFFGDLPFHIQDLTLFGGENKIGFGLWQFKWIAFGVESVFFLTSVAAFLLRVKLKREERRSAVYTTMICVIMLFVNFAQIVPAKSVRELGVSALLSYLAVPGIAWFLIKK